ncbi:MAG: PAS domain-containing protein [Candidatus Cloacimonetes bacterium]|nr:PAS domain-containing protein [Candidatus Cloacimonadota bacterium]
MKLAPDNVFKLAVFAFLLCIFILVYYQFRIIQRETEAMWRTIVSGFTEEKNTHLNNTFFYTANNLQAIDSLNWHYFRSMIESDTTLRNLQLVRLNVFDTNETLRYSYTRNTLDEYISDENIYELVQGNIRGNETTIMIEEHLGTNLGIVITPLIRRNNMHFLTIVYVFDVDQTRLRGLHFYDVFLIGFIAFLTFFIFMYLYKLAIEKSVDNITKYMEISISEKNKSNVFQLSNDKPFQHLIQKISYLISQKKESEKKYLDYSDKFYYFINLTGEGLVMEDETGYIYFCNKKFVEILGYEDESELLGIKLVDLFFNPDEIDNYESSINVSAINFQSTNKVDFLTKNGMKKECLLSKKVITDNNNSLIGYYCAVTDIVGVSTYHHSQSEIQYLRSNIFEQYTNPLIILDQNEKIVDVNEAFINIVKNSRNEVISRPFIDTIKGFELEQVWHPNIKELEVFEPEVNKWFQIIVKNMQINDKHLKLVHAFAIDQFKKQHKYNKLILNDFRGFYFITDRDNQVLYVSQSFTNITNNTEAWFMDYYKALINLSLSKSQNLLETMTVSNQKKKFEFRITQLYTYNETMILYQAVLK